MRRLMTKRRHNTIHQRLYLKLTVSWAVAWIVGIACLGTLAISMNARLGRVGLEDMLRLRAMAVYGLSWFDAQGRFHDELLHKEPGLLTGGVDIWVISQRSPDTVLLRPKQAIFNIRAPAELANANAGSEDGVIREGRDSSGASYLSLAKTTYDDADHVAARILVLGDPRAIDAAHAVFTRNLLFAVTALALLGLAVGTLLARQALRPVVETMDIRERLIAAAAHELRAPVANLLAICDSVGYGDISLDEGFTQVRHVARTSATLIDKLLLLAQLDSSAAGVMKEKVRLDLIVEAALPEGHGITTDMEESVVVADPRLLQIAVRNLIENALTHGRTDSDTGASVHVTVRHHTVTIEDDGAGFPMDQLASAREAFRKAPGSPGYGLGLSIVQHIAELHGGQLILENLAPHGARVRLQIS
ncbi:sensor histidine kinase [Dyella subtropica]|uniref:sensor histidine kinase n=1 Tax=Dyella subtropica TaxID=2992127 RepID=UPI002251337C|nr:HAMP domain-containing sensor histidine kinase [Dyella subtropica]